MDTNNFVRRDLIVHAPYQNDVSHSLEDICHGRTIVLRVFGRFGCPFTRLDAKRLSGQSEKLEALGASLVGVGFDKKGAEEFRASGFWKGEVYLDHDRSVYDFFQLPHASKLQTMKCLAKKPIRALYASLKHVYGGNFQGDIFQTGGTFVLNCKGRVLYACPQSNITVFSDLLQVLDICQKEFTHRTFKPIPAFTETLKKVHKPEIHPAETLASPVPDSFRFNGNVYPVGAKIKRLKIIC
ncbi:hypothetical protein DSO57_1008916 [Entomophthora muscae]|uniref:Uncharacterized protein n=1 Tax=Entomophthora muscae TaxID=34485 RepID=A0ACC2SK17_9FUNG|nr:hypothetical protein DSO57_1008916 [Entomophthora muscae]